TQALAANAPVDQFRTVAQGLQNQAASLNNLVDTRQATYDLLSLTRRELDAAQNAKNDVTAERAQVDALSPQLDAAGDLNTIVGIRNQVQAIKNAIDAKYLAALYGVGKVIVVSVDQERLVALQDGVIVLNTLVTTGRPSLPTVIGTFHILFKSSPYHMCTPPQWKGTQYDYGCVNEQWAMEFESSGYFIHDAYWRHSFGPGTDTQAGGTHGCVNLPNASMQWLYGWAPTGTTVITKHGDLPG
ncbi:MAG TPA: L,D-transpeptidase, partial [Candidatus Dormibacteraeota bacterium]|nr:L,D-transpeptidase [Candidatus Dormibacteraeota bacterium]